MVEHDLVNQPFTSLQDLNTFYSMQETLLADDVFPFPQLPTVPQGFELPTDCDFILQQPMVIRKKYHRVRGSETAYCVVQSVVPAKLHEITSAHIKERACFVITRTCPKGTAIQESVRKCYGNLMSGSGGNPVLQLGQPSPIGSGHKTLFDVMYDDLYCIEQAMHIRQGGIGIKPLPNKLCTNKYGNSAMDLGGTHSFAGLYNALCDVGK